MRAVVPCKEKERKKKRNTCISACSTTQYTVHSTQYTAHSVLLLSPLPSPVQRKLTTKISVGTTQRRATLGKWFIMNDYIKWFIAYHEYQRRYSAEEGDVGRKGERCVLLNGGGDAGEGVGDDPEVCKGGEERKRAE